MDAAGGLGRQQHSFQPGPLCKAAEAMSGQARNGGGCHWISDGRLRRVSRSAAGTHMRTGHQSERSRGTRPHGGTGSSTRRARTAACSTGLRYSCCANCCQHSTAQASAPSRRRQMPGQWQGPQPTRLAPSVPGVRLPASTAVLTWQSVYYIMANSVSDIARWPLTQDCDLASGSCAIFDCNVYDRHVPYKPATECSQQTAAGCARRSRVARRSCSARTSRGSGSVSPTCRRDPSCKATSGCASACSATASSRSVTSTPT